ncbi:hypothetical protein [Novosphingobium album (ex Liu et al. 2023)]|uniref:Acyl-protein synthetase LuxE domain-containing protein n=1 Tax=Novosphingobium album (ex Liu et al. 2023) TaxID=3031130 RepID=A0ABT5WW81_9SPHN|nr:hypothetical protein [Novosphingobium album (ex Liu et al. 2023)]MDE8654147.1 hypothetical protein [Novosphingobium album (ex Liu et al. 2023)]
MGAAADKLTALVADPGRFAFSAEELRETQVAALDERFQDRKGRIRLLGLRARDAGIDRIGAITDIVPLLFPHTAYKSYPESFLMEERWDRLTRWLGTISPYPIEGLELDGVEGIDDWIERLSALGHFISCSSGTTGKSAMLIASQKDMDWSRIDTVNVFSWGSGVKPARDRLIIGCAPVATVPKNRTIAQAQYDAFANPEWPRWHYPVPPITVGSLTAMVVMRKKIADGTARPDEVAAFEETSQARQQAIDAAVPATADFIIANRHRKLQLAGLWSGLWQVARAVRERGYGRDDFDPDNSIYVGGGLKRAQLPADYQEFVFETFNIPADRHFQNYSMQELNSGMPKCREGGRYHVPPWIVPILLDKPGDSALGHSHGECEGRAAFFDLSLDGRWGGVITGDRISLDYGPCACGNAGPSIRDTITRYADLEGDDKIGCAGTVDAYVRGVA